MSTVCTKGKDGKLYYFRDGKRVSSSSVQEKVKCKLSKATAPKKSIPPKTPTPPVKASAKKERPEPIVKPKKQVYLWAMGVVAIPDGRTIVVPTRYIGEMAREQLKDKAEIGKIYHKEKLLENTLAYVDEKENAAIAEFLRESKMWNTSLWNTFINLIYPNLSKKIHVIKGKDPIATYYLWNLTTLLIPGNRYIVVPLHHIDFISSDKLKDADVVHSFYQKYGLQPNTLAYVDKQTHEALKEFEEAHTTWDESRWDTFLTFIYPTLSEHINVLKGKM